MIGIPLDGSQMPITADALVDHQPWHGSHQLGQACCVPNMHISRSKLLQKYS